MAVRTKWTLRVQRLRTSLVFEAGAAPEPVEVCLTLQGLAQTRPRTPQDRIDLDAVCTWITRDWSRGAPAPMLETRVNELLDHVFGFDRRVHEARVGVYRWPGGDGNAVIGVERHATRGQFSAQQRLQRA